MELPRKKTGQLRTYKAASALPMEGEADAALPFVSEYEGDKAPPDSRLVSAVFGLKAEVTFLKVDTCQEEPDASQNNQQILMREIGRQIARVRDQVTEVDWMAYKAVHAFGFELTKCRDERKAPIQGQHACGLHGRANHQTPLNNGRCHAVCRTYQQGEKCSDNRNYPFNGI